MQVNHLKSILARLSPQGVNRHIASIASGTVAGQVVVFAMSPILTRLYSPDDFGIYSYILGLASFTAVVIGLRLDLAILVAETDEEAGRIARIALLAATLLSLLCGVGIALFGGDIDRTSSLNLMPWLWLLPPIVWTLACYTILSQLSVRCRDYKAVAVRSFTQNLTMAAVQLAWPFGRSPAGLLVGQVCGRLLSSIELARRNRLSLFVARPFAGWRVSARRFWRFPVLVTPSAALNILGTLLPLFILGAWFGADTAGQFGIAQQVVAVPAALLGVAISQVFMGEFSSRYRAGNRDNRSGYLAATKRLSLVAAPITLGLLLLSPWVFPFVFGDQWSEAGLFAQAMSISTGVGFVVSPLSQVFFVYERIWQIVLVDALRIPFVGGAALVVHAQGVGPTGTLWAMYTGQVAIYALTWIMGLRIVSSQRIHPEPLPQ